VTRIRPFQRMTLAACSCVIAALTITHAQQPEVRFAGAYSELGDRRQQLIDNWVARFIKTTGQQVSLRVLWRKEDANWRITPYDIKQP
jgi:hypothetical protein